MSTNTHEIPFNIYNIDNAMVEGVIEPGHAVVSSKKLVIFFRAKYADGYVADYFPASRQR
ncbi:MAG: hypothetical protein ACRDTE_23080 [Pseudonocardiaceae bacterium]